jgi:hypothetical protein
LPPVPVAARLRTIQSAVQAAIATTIVFAVLASGSIESWIPPARRLRWLALAALVALALVWAWQRRTARLPATGLAAAGALLAVSFVSAAWSADPERTIARAVAFSLVLVAAAALAWAAAGRPRAADAVLDAVVAGAALVAIGGLLVLLFRYERAVAPATTTSPARYQGLGGGPNTATMLLAVALPAAAHVALDSAPPLRRTVGWLVAAGLLASIVASGSRGALVAAFGGVLVYALRRAPTSRQALAGAAITVVLFAAAAAAAALPDRAPPGTTAAEVAADPNPPPVEAVPPFVDANLVLRLQDDVGRPPPGTAATEDPGRTLTGSSGRDEAWLGAMEQAGQRPLLGYGFGTEGKVFVDRYVGFNSGVPENSYLGLVLQLGVVGLALFVALAVVLFMPAVWRVPRGQHTRGLTGASAGMLAAGLVLGLFQSFVYAAGNNATAALWIGAFLLLALHPRADAQRR